MKLAFVNGIILDGTADMEPLYDHVVLVDGEKITAIVPKQDATLTGYEEVDLKGAYLMPGLINLHLHLALSGKPPKAQKEKPTNYTLLVKLATKVPGVPAYYKRMEAGFAKTALMSGVTTMRVVGGVGNFDTSVRNRINKGKAVGPRILTSAYGVSVPGGHFAGSIATEAKTPEDARRDVRKVHELKPDLIKLMITGGVMDSSESGEPGALRMPPEIVKAACDEAHKLGYYVAAHVESTEGVRVALENGVDTIEHGSFLDDDLIKLFKEKGAADICTISPALPYCEFDLSESKALPIAKENGKIVMEGIIECAKACRENGIPVGLGNDEGCPFIVHYDFWRELYYFHKYVGASNKETLHTATLGNAKIVGIDDLTGSIEPGKSADLIVTKGNPLEDITVLRDVSGVCIKGTWHADPQSQFKKRPEVDALLDKYM
ncbi:MAG: amidohydrolase family protein [Clostridia bacterium]|nr:amidohydrolase family protein [Clostridia bacterium]